MENTAVKAKHIAALNWLLIPFSLTERQVQGMTLNYPNLYYDLNGRCALRTSLGSFSLKTKITKTQTTQRIMECQEYTFIVPQVTKVIALVH